jgi:hypothetical protein
MRNEFSEESVGLHAMQLLYFLVAIVRFCELGFCSKAHPVRQYLEHCGALVSATAIAHRRMRRVRHKSST